MKVVALISGGKDSCFNMMQCVAEGHEIVALANLKPQHKDELDSYMYQTVGHNAIGLFADAMELSLYCRVIQGSSIAIGKDYQTTTDDEVEDLYELLKAVQEQVGVEAVSVGAILSDYQRVRVEHVCSRLGLTSLAYLWRRDQAELLEEMIQCQLVAIIIKVAALGLEPDKHLGRTLEEIQPHMNKMHEKYGLNICGEGGEFETFTLDCPLFKKKIVIDEMETVTHSDDAFAPVAYINFKKMHLENKSHNFISLASDLHKFPMKHSRQLVSELFVSDSPQVFDIGHMTPCTQCQRLMKKGEYTRVSRHRDMVYITGLVAIDSDGETVTQHTVSIMNQIKGVVRREGLHMENVVTVYMYVQKMSDFMDINTAYKSFFSINPPIRACVEASLPDNVRLLLSVVVCETQPERPRITMHVQGLSHWAPANIGPYSQACRLGEEIFVAGQIGLIPATLAIIPGGPQAESRLSLRHASRILQAMQPDLTLQHVTQAVCYVTHPDYIPMARGEWERARGEGDGACGVGYVVVSSLPRAATVEWQVCAHCGMDTDTRTVKDETEASVSPTAAVRLLSESVACVRECGDIVTSPGLLTVFYSPERFALDQLYGASQQVLTDDGMPAISFIPVQSMEHKNGLLLAVK